MAIGDPYITVADLVERLGRLPDGTFDAVILSASRAVESFTGRQFNREETASARRFRAIDWCRLPVDDFYTLEDLTVEVAETLLVVGDIDPRPWDGIVNGQSGWPFFDLFTVKRHWPYSRRATVTVTARWGWEAVPEAIRQATLDVAADMVTGGAGSGDVKSESIDGYSVSYDVGTGSSSTDVGVFNRAAPYRRKTFGVA